MSWQYTGSYPTSQASAAAQLAADFAKIATPTAAQILSGVTAHAIDASGNQTTVVGTHSSAAPVDAAYVMASQGGNILNSDVLLDTPTGAAAGGTLTLSDYTQLPVSVYEGFDPAADDKFGMVALEGLTEVQVSLDVRYKYHVTHTGMDGDGNSDASSLVSAWLSTASNTIATDKTVQDEKFELPHNESEVLGPGISKLYLRSTIGADAVLKIVRLGTPTNSY